MNPLLGFMIHFWCHPEYVTVKDFDAMHSIHFPNYILRFSLKEKKDNNDLLLSES